MSIRLLTVGLENEAHEKRRRQHYDVARLREPQNNPTSPEPSFLSGKGRRQEKPKTATPAVAKPAPRQISLKARDTNNPWGVPGGIAARFGKDALQEQEEILEPVELEPQEDVAEVAVPEPAEEQPTEPAAEQTEDETKTTQEETSEDDNNSSITIELQSSH